MAKSPYHYPESRPFPSNCWFIADEHENGGGDYYVIRHRDQHATDGIITIQVSRCLSPTKARKVAEAMLKVLNQL